MSSKWDSRLRSLAQRNGRDFIACAEGEKDALRNAAHRIGAEMRTPSVGVSMEAGGVTVSYMKVARDA